MNYHRCYIILRFAFLLGLNLTACVSMNAMRITLPTPTYTPTILPPTTEPATTPAPQAPFPDPGGYEWRAIAIGMSNPVGLENAGDGSGRLFVLEQEGLIRIIREGEVLGEPFLDISSQISCCWERGLLGLAFHPNYIENGFIYVNYTDQNGDTSISRFSVSDDPDRVDAGTEVRLLWVEQPFPNHNGGAVGFGPDGYLYIGLGDGGDGWDPLNNAQNTDVMLGKILRLDVDGGEPYAIPPDNPFVEGGGAPEVWAYGLRNPWRFAFDRQTFDLYIGDVGQNWREEINFLPAGSPGGANFGWSYMEGFFPSLPDILPPEGLELVNPAVEYQHDHGCSVTGGKVYRGEQLPEWQGIYLYGDFCSGKIWGLVHGEAGAWQNLLLFETSANISSFGEDEDGEIYLTDHKGEVLRLVEK